MSLNHTSISLVEDLHAQNGYLASYEGCLNMDFIRQFVILSLQINF